MIKKIILMIVLIMSINVSYADSGQFVYEGDYNHEFYTGEYEGGVSYISGFGIFDISQYNDLEYIMIETTQSGLTLPPESSLWTSVSLLINGNVVGAGTYGYIKYPGDIVKIVCIISSFDVQDYSGNVVVSFIFNDENLLLYGRLTPWTLSYTPGSLSGYFISPTQHAVINYPSNSLMTLQTSYSYTNDYEYDIENGFLKFTLDRSESETIKTVISNNYYEILNETTYSWENLDEGLTVYNEDINNNTWVIDGINIYDDEQQKIIVFSSEFIQSSAEITLNQTSYTSPEIIKSDITLSNSDFNNNYYRIKTMYSPLNDIYDYTSVIYNQSQIISSDESSYLITLNENYYDLPIKVMITVEQYNKNTGVSTVIGESNKVLYNPTGYYDFIYEGYVLNVLNNAYISDVDISFNNGINYINTTSNYKGYFKVYLTVNEYDVIVTHDDYNTWVYNDVFIEKAQTTNIYLSPLITGVNLYGNVQNFNDLSPLSNVKILISNNTFSTYVYTNNYGYFEVLNIINNENYTVCTEYENYYNYNELIQTELTGTTHLSILLIPITYDDIDEDIAVQIDELKKEIQPIKDLIFGLSEIVIDNPDYNDDNIITQNEYSTWINSFISIAIVIFIVIIAIGLKERRSKKL